MVPSCGRSFAVSGSTMPLFVISSRGVGRITSRSPRGLSCVAAVTVVAMCACCLLRSRTALQVPIGPSAGAVLADATGAGTPVRRVPERYTLGQSLVNPNGHEEAAPDRHPTPLQCCPAASRPGRDREGGRDG